jgi:hypothetical protein
VRAVAGRDWEWEPVAMASGGQVASLEQRAAAALIDAGLFTAALCAAVGGAVGIAVALDRRSDLKDRLEGIGDRARTALESERVKRSLGAASFLANVGLRNARSPGMRGMHLRRADARTGGPVTLRSAIIGQVCHWAWGRISPRLWRPRWERHQARMHDLQTELQELRRQHPDDKEAEAAFYSSHKNVIPKGCCVWIVLSHAVQTLPTLFTPRRQTLWEWVAGIVVLRD